MEKTICTHIFWHLTTYENALHCQNAFRNSMIDSKNCFRICSLFSTQWNKNLLNFYLHWFTHNSIWALQPMVYNLTNKNALLNFGFSIENTTIKLFDFISFLQKSWGKKGSHKIQKKDIPVTCPNLLLLFLTLDTYQICICCIAKNFSAWLSSFTNLTKSTIVHYKYWPSSSMIWSSELKRWVQITCTKANVIHHLLNYVAWYNFRA